MTPTAKTTVPGDGFRGVLVENLAQRIQALVISGEIPVGSWLRQEALAVEFGVSRTPVREALRQLHAAGVVDFVPRRGVLVRGPTVREIREAYLVRAELEGLAMDLAVPWIGAREIQGLNEAVNLFRGYVRPLRASPKTNSRPPHKPEPWDRANTAFHEIFLEASRNRRLRETVAHLHRSLPRNLTWPALRENPRLLEENVMQHQQILEAVEAGDATLSRQLMTSHIRRAGEIVADWFERQTADVVADGAG